MKWVYLIDGVVREIIPDYATPPEKWYGPEFAAKCVEAPNDVEQGWVYDRESGTFAPPVEIEPEPVIDPQEDTDAMLVDHELRLTLLELGGI